MSPRGASPHALLPVNAAAPPTTWGHDAARGRHRLPTHHPSRPRRPPTARPPACDAPRRARPCPGRRGPALPEHEVALRLAHRVERQHVLEGSSSPEYASVMHEAALPGLFAVHRASAWW
ncbi:Scr1 family TA system antitoxin-like transcriptional regulator [Streptomyces sp. NPDC047982]|uniref:Scr1 family TA system antitoxin-like transcriptional regulator n=1 Tax=Streptomyces sp. NPDC047982 TaxID=3365495 RepID=UPI00371C0A39